MFKVVVGLCCRFGGELWRSIKKWICMTCRRPVQAVKFRVMTSRPISCLQPTVITALGLASLMNTVINYWTYTTLLSRKKTVPGLFLAISLSVLCQFSSFFRCCEQWFIRDAAETFLITLNYVVTLPCSVDYICHYHQFGFDWFA